MRILLVQPPFSQRNSCIAALGVAEPLGLEYVAAAVPRHEVRILDLRLGGSLAAALAEHTPRVVGVSAVTAGLPQALAVLREARQHDPGITTVIGGVHPTLLPEDCQRDEVDVIVRGEGEPTFAALITHLERGESLAGVAGLSYRDGGGWHANPDRELGPLDAYAPPARELTAGDRDAYARVGLGHTLSLVSSRGCSRRCTFCSVWRVHGGLYRTRSPEKIAEEIAARPERSVDLVDDDSFASLPRMERLRELLIEQAPGRVLKAFVRAESVVRSPAHFERWAGAGLRYLLIGLESFSDDELRDFEKRATAAENREAVRLLRGMGIGVVGYLIVRQEHRVEDFERLGEQVDELEIDQPIFTTLTPSPGTPLFEQHRHLIGDRSWEDFDGFRSVLPTALPPEEFYHQLAELYRRAYRRRQPARPGDPPPWYERLASAIEGIARS